MYGDKRGARYIAVNRKRRTAPEGSVKDFEFYETPQAFTRYLFHELRVLGHPIAGTVFEPCVGSYAIPRAASTFAADIGQPAIRWVTNDLDRQWGNADWHGDATKPECWTRSSIDWTATNPPFSPAVAIIRQAIAHSRVGVAMHLRASIHEVLKTGERRTFLAEQTPTGILWLPRFAYQRSKTTGQWTTDSVCACWVVWLKDPTVPQFIRYAPEWVLDELERETPIYRDQMER